MKSATTRTLMLIMAMAAFIGCQSGPRFAWWKHDDKAPDSSAVARSAEPTLPSAQSTPQPVAVAGLTPAASPSSTNLAAAGASTSPPNISIPVTPATVANAPLANYPAGNSLADKLTAKPTAAPSAAVPAAPAATTPSQPIAAVPPAGPYDPNAYKPGASLASSAADPAAADNDRYGLGSSGRNAAPAPLNASQPAVSQSSDRYGAVQPPAVPAVPPAAVPIAAQPAADRYGATMPPTTASQTPAAPFSTVTSAPASAPFSAAPLSPPAANSSPFVNLSAAPGQYRPGGTSSYTGAPATRPVEIATRPSPPAPAKPAPAQLNVPPSSSEPWAPPAAPLASPGTRTY